MLLTVEAPFTFDQSGYQSETSAFLRANPDLAQGNGKEVFGLPGRDVLYVSDTLFSCKRFLHVLECARANFARGALTWSLVDAHHVTLLGFKAVAAFYGILLHQVLGRTILLDVFPGSGRSDDRAKFEKAYSTVEDPVAILVPRATVMDQKPLRDLLEHLGRISVKKSQIEKDFFRSLDRFVKSSRKTPRNDVIYSSVYWPWPRDLTLLEEDVDVKEALCVDEEAGFPKLLDLMDNMEALNREFLQEFSDRVGFDWPSLHPLAVGVGRRALVC